MASDALTQQNNTAAVVIVIHFIMGISWYGVSDLGTEANPGPTHWPLVRPLRCTPTGQRLELQRGIDTGYFRLSPSPGMTRKPHVGKPHPGPQPVFPEMPGKRQAGAVH